jgi:hypothetical protein
VRGARPEYNGVLQIDPEEIRQRFDQLSDEGLLSIDRNELIELAQQYYDAEISRRGLRTTPAAPAQENAEEQLVPLSTFDSLEEANLVRALLESADIPVKLDNELSSQWTGAGGLRLMVPASSLEQAEEILQAQISEDDLIAQAEAAEPEEPVEPVPEEDQDRA